MREKHRKVCRVLNYFEYFIFLCAVKIKEQFNESKTQKSLSVFKLLWVVCFS